MKANYANGLYKQYEETMALLEKLNAKLDKQEQEHQKEITELKEEHRREIAELKNEIHVRDEIIKDLKARNETLEEEVSRLKSIINNDSNNSSTPPSQDQKPTRPRSNEYNSRIKSGKSKGAQPGHRGNTLSEADVERILATKDCVHRIRNVGKVSGDYVTRYEVSIRVIPVVTEYRIYRNKRGVFEIPTVLRSKVTYGNEIKTMVIALYGIGVLSNDRISDFIRGITGDTIRLATGTVYRFCRVFSDMATNSLRNIEERLLNNETVYTDATTVSVNGLQAYIRNVSTENAVRYYGMPRKTAEEVRKIKVLNSHVGVMVHDHETVMYRFSALHAECNVHILRYLRKNYQDTGNDWGEKMSYFLTHLNETRKGMKERGELMFSDEDILRYESEYDEILAYGNRQNETTSPKWAKREEAALLRRLCKYKANHLAFIHKFGINFDNNISERDLRKCKSRQKISGGFRTTEGCAMFCDILSIIESAKRLSMNVFSAISDIFSGFSLFPLGNPAEL